MIRRTQEYLFKNSLTTPKRYWEDSNWRRTNNTMPKQNRIKRQTMVHNTLHRKLKM